MAKIEISASLLSKVVASDPLAGWMPKSAWKPVAAELVSAIEQSKQSSPTVPDVRLEMKVNGMTVKTYASSLMAVWQGTGTKEQLFINGSTDKVKILNPKLKLGYEAVEGNPKYPFRMVVAVK